MSDVPSQLVADVLLRWVALDAPLELVEQVRAAMPDTGIDDLTEALAVVLDVRGQWATDRAGTWVRLVRQGMHPRLAADAARGIHASNWA